MSRASSDEQVQFLLSCIRYSVNGKIDFAEVAKECNIVSKGAASKRYERMLKAHNINPHGTGPSSPTKAGGSNEPNANSSASASDTKTSPTKRKSPTKKATTKESSSAKGTTTTTTTATAGSSKARDKKRMKTAILGNAQKIVANAIATAKIKAESFEAEDDNEDDADENDNDETQGEGEVGLGIHFNEAMYGRDEVKVEDSEIA